ncbi:hypothetical protein [Rhizobium sp. Rhizsp82]|uniref:hypothetical protein n=1 Tax=Rhizobium sp. Rhizsp82 TaxID=3243057 RepID=UPI0039B3AC48
MLIEFFRETGAPPAADYDMILNADGVMCHVHGRRRQKRVLRVLVQHEGAKVSSSQAVAMTELVMKHGIVTLAFYDF